MNHKDYKGYLIDLDGTIYRGTESILEATKFIKRLQDAQIPYLFLTNNTTRTRQMVVDKLAGHGISATIDQIYTPSLATRDYLLAENNGKPTTIYLVGEIGLYQALLEAGFTLDNQHPDYVIVGLDSDLTYDKIKKATLAIRSGSKFIGTNADKNLPNEEGLVPGAGSVIAFVEATVQKKAFYIGKPERIIVDMALQVLGLQKDDVLVVGDNYDTDIKAGINSEMDSLLVYTGVSTKEQVKRHSIQPTYEIDSLDEWEVWLQKQTCSLRSCFI